jgi:hypothetical protein
MGMLTGFAALDPGHLDEASMWLSEADDHTCIGIPSNRV